MNFVSRKLVKIFKPIVVVVIALLYYLGPFWNVEFYSQDLRFKARGELITYSDPIIVEIDDKTVDKWSKPSIFWGSDIAKTIEKIVEDGANKIGIDIVFASNTDEYLQSNFGIKAPQPNFDLAETIAKYPDKIVIASKDDLPPIEELQNVAKFGSTDIPEMLGGAVRRLYVLRKDTDSFVKLMADNRGPDIVVWINYSNKPFKRISASDVMEGNFPSSTFDDKTVFFGVTFSGSGDYHKTPIAENVPGVIIQAEAWTTITSEAELTVYDSWASFIWTLVFGLIFVCLLSFNWKIDFIILIVVLGLTALMGQLMLYDLNVMVPMAGPIAIILFSPILLYCVKGIGTTIDKSNVEAVFGALVSPQVRDKLLANQSQIPTAVVDSTVLFVDIRGFTSKSEKMETHLLFNQVNQLFELFINDINRNNGLVLSFLGDGFFAIFGAPVALPNSAQSALRCAEQMLDSLKKFNGTHQGEPWQIGIGIHTGEVLTGNLGSKERYQFTAMGDTVNTSARLQDESKQLGFPVVISESTYRLLAKSPGAHGPFEVNLRGKKERTVVYCYGTKS